MTPPTDLSNYRTLKLDASWQPIAVIPAHEALVDTILGRAIVLETYDRLVNSPGASWKLPAVIVLRSVVKKFMGNLPCCRKYIHVRDRGECQYCGVNINQAAGTVDHVHPKSRGGDWSWTNLVLACTNCNQAKGDKTPKEAGMKLRSRPRSLTYREYISLTDRRNKGIWEQYL